MMFKATILVDNIPHDNCEAEWGFSVQIDYQGHSYLLDTGSSNLYLTNAGKLGVGIADVDAAVLSHAHCDHSGGYDSFFRDKKRVHDPSAPYDAYDESDDTEENAKSGFLKGVGR